MRKRNVKVIGSIDSKTGETYTMQNKREKKMEMKKL